jgi:spore coat polysaccharide biosynthesis predicted glycosyltransferase SpsG|tara:strand:+ start:29100 stop:30059 length:960 start_codon:yes stop_codon:yes gene_type:complete
MVNIIFRTDADDGTSAGTGHLSRILKIRKYYLGTKKKINFIFLFKNLNNSHKIFSKFKNKIIYDNTFVKKLSYINSNDIIIIDTPFGADEKLKKFCAIKKINNILLIDDLNRPKFKNAYIFNGIISFKKQLPCGRKTYQGSKYVILDKEYSNTYQLKNKNAILVATGGTDKKKLLFKYSNYLIKNYDYKIYVIIGNQVKANNPIFSLDSNKLIFVRSPKSLLKYYLNAKICIITGGIIMFENLALKKKSLIHQSYHHQKYAVDYFKNNNQIIKVGENNKINFKKMDYYLKSNINNNKNIFNKIDGKGFFRLQQILKKFK